MELTTKRLASEPFPDVAGLVIGVSVGAVPCQYNGYLGLLFSIKLHLTVFCAVRNISSRIITELTTGADDPGGVSELQFFSYVGEYFPL